MSIVGFSDLLTDWLSDVPETPELKAGYGRDLWCTDDLQEAAIEVEGLEAVAQNLYRRLSTDRGSLLGCPDYGLDIRSFLHKGMTATNILAIPAIIEQEVRKEQRVLNVSVQVTYQTLERLELNVIVEAVTENGETGQFSLTCNVTQAGVEIAGLELT